MDPRDDGGNLGKKEGILRKKGEWVSYDPRPPFYEWVPVVTRDLGTLSTEGPFPCFLVLAWPNPRCFKYLGINQ